MIAEKRFSQRTSGNICWKWQFFYSSSMWVFDEFKSSATKCCGRCVLCKGGFSFGKESHTRPNPKSRSQRSWRDEKLYAQRKRPRHLSLALNYSNQQNR